MKPSLFIISSAWSPDLIYFLQCTQDSFEITLLTEKGAAPDIDLALTLWECFETYSVGEITKIFSMLMMKEARAFHFIFPPSPTLRTTKGYLLLATLLGGLPHTQLTHSSPPFPHSKPRRVGLSTLLSLSKNEIGLLGPRWLNLSPPDRTSSSPFEEGPPSNHAHYAISDPSILLAPSAFREDLKQRLHSNTITLEMANWEGCNLRLKNQIRQFFGEAWKNITLRPLPQKIYEWKNIGVLILAPHSPSPPLSEGDLLSLLLEFKITLVLPSERYFELKGPWRHGDTCWVWNDQAPNHLSFNSIEDLENFNTHEINRTLRTINRLDFLQQPI